MDTEKAVLNPLLNEVVLQVIFSYLDNSTLKSIRFVHSSWAKEAFNQLRKSSTVKLDNAEKLKNFLNSAWNNRFFGFGFHIEKCDWSEDLFNYLTEVEPRSMDVYYSLILDADDFESFDKLSRILRQYCNKIRVLCVSNNYALMFSQPNPNIQDSLLKIQYPQLKSLSICNEVLIDPEHMLPLFIGILKCSPKLSGIESNIKSVQFWEGLREVANIKELDTLTVRQISPAIVSICVAIPNLTLKKLSIQFDPAEVSTMLSRFAASIEDLQFFTIHESALSPIDFPVMPRLKSLSAGKSQLSFPSILAEKLPVLDKLSATYWDWVFTFEVLPDIHHYWQTCQPHNNVTTFDVTFPERTHISGDYVTMENFVDFSNRIKIKFPNLTNVLLGNVVVKEGIQSCIAVLAEAFGPQLKELTIKGYSSISDCSSTGLFSSLSNCINLEILDLDPSCWSTLWEKKSVSRNIKFEEFNLAITPLTKLQILKIPYVQGFLIQNLFGNGWERFPELTVLGILGDRCINRFDKANLRRCRPTIQIMFYDCFCSEEGNWWDKDPSSHLIFQRLFDAQP